MASFDLISEVSVQEVDNAVNQAKRELETRYDFKGKKYSIELDKEKCEVKLESESESHVVAMFDILSNKFLKRSIDLGALEVGKIEAIGGIMMRRVVKVKQGLETEVAKKINKIIKEAKLKVDTQIQDKQIRVSSKKIDDLQEVIALVKSKQSELKIPLQFVNMKS